MGLRAVFVDEGNDAAYHVLQANDIADPYYSVRDPRVTLPYLLKVDLSCVRVGNRIRFCQRDVEAYLARSNRESQSREP